MQFTPEQVRSLIGVSRETLRHWRKAIPYLSRKSGKAARFTLADVIGLAVTQELVEKLGVQIASVGKAVDMMFGLLAATSPDTLDLCQITLSSENARLQHQQSDADGMLGHAAIVVPLAPLVSGIQQSMFPIASRMRQRDLRFPPESVRRQA